MVKYSHLWNSTTVSILLAWLKTRAKSGLVCIFFARLCGAAELCYSVEEGDRNLSWPFVNSLCVQPYSTLVIKPLHDFTAVVMEQ